MKNFKTLILAGSAFAAIATSVFAENAAAPKETAVAAAPEAAKKDDNGPKPIGLKMAGNITAVAGGASQKDAGGGKNGGIGFVMPVSDLKLVVGGKTASAYEYGYTVRLRAINGSTEITRSYVDFAGPFGSIQLGNVKGVDDSMGTYGAYNIMGGTGGGTNGSVPSYFNISAGAIQGNTIIGSPDIATKINFTSPVVEGFKVGFSFTPDTSHRGKQDRNVTQATTKSDGGNEGAIYPGDNQYAFGINNMVFGLSYDKKFGDVDVLLNFVTIRETERYVFSQAADVSGAIVPGSRTTFSPAMTKSYVVSAQLTYKDIELAASWMDNKKSRLPSPAMEDKAKSTTPDPTTNILPSKEAYFPVAGGYGYAVDGNAGNAWNVGARYTFGAYQAALGYFKTSRNTSAIGKATLEAVTATLDLKALEGLVFFGEVTALQTKTSDAAYNATYGYNAHKDKGVSGTTRDNKGAVFMLGTKVSF